MKSLSPHDPLDDLIAAALHGELTPEERTQLDSRLSNDAAARAAYLEAQLMHDLLEKTHRSAQPDPAFEQRMVSGVRRKLKDEANHRETAWESVLVLWAMLKVLPRKVRLVEVAVVLGIVAILAGVALGPITNGIKKAKQSSALQKALADQQSQLGQDIAAQETQKVTKSGSGTLSLAGANTYTGGTTVSGGTLGIGHTTSTYTDSAKTENKPSAWDENWKKRDVGRRLENEKQLAQVNEKPTDVSDVSTPQPEVKTQNELKGSMEIAKEYPASPAAAETPAPDTRKLIRNAQLELEVKSFQAAMDQISALTKAAGGYVDTSNSQKGGNGKLQGTVVVKVLPQNLDGFLLKLRDLGQIANQSVSTEDVTKDYYDTQARLENSRKMEIQLQELLKRNNGKVSELLQVERELGRVRGEIEQMQGSLKLYDFQVQYATVTIQMREKDLNQAAAYLLKEQDNFSLFATDVEATFQKARATAEEFKAQILVANLNHNSGSDVSAELEVMVAPEQIEPFLAQVRLLGRVANFTRETQRVAKDGGDSDQPADQALTEKDKVQVHLAIRSDDETRKQVALTVVTSTVDASFEQAKAAALAQAGTEILSSSLNKTPQGQATARLSLRVPGQGYPALIDALRALGRTSSLSIQREDDAGPGANGDDAPVIVTLALTDEDTPLQQTDMSVLATDVDGQAQQIKKEAASAGVEVKASSFARQPNGTELAQMTFRLPMAKYPAFVESLKKLGKVESLSVQRQDRPDQTRTDDTAPAEISLQLHNQADLVAEDEGLWATLRKTFGEGVSALFTSVRVIGVLVAFLAPWVVTLVLVAWVGRRIYLWRKK